MRIIPVSRPESKHVNILFVKYESEVSVEWFYSISMLQNVAPSF